MKQFESLPAKSPFQLSARPTQKQLDEHATSPGLRFQVQAPLQLESLLESFAQLLATTTTFKGLSYQLKTTTTRWETGELAGHNAHYDLNYQGQDLGELTVYRRQIFDPASLNLLEEALCYLCTPLHHAVLYLQAQRDACLDELTGLPNRRTFKACVERELAQAGRQGWPICLAMIDIDHFKKINDACGHITGDEMISETASLLKSGIRTSDGLFRYGGEEFVLLLPDTHLAGAVLLAQRLRRKIATTRFPALPNQRLTVSIGLATWRPGLTVQEWLREADEKLYEAKYSGRNRLSYSDPGARPGTKRLRRGKNVAERTD